ncbi:MAG: hypothetical protein ACOYB3_02125 [Azonexus sp.]
MNELEIIEVKPGLRFSLGTLKTGLPNIETALFFAKLYKLSAMELGHLLRVVFNEYNLVQVLMGEDNEHSYDLQDYLLELGYEYLINEGAIVFGEKAPHGEILPELWKDLEVTIASSIEQVAEKLKDVVGALPGKQGEMVFQTMMTVNARRPILGDHKAFIHHAPQRENLVVLDVSGSMSEHTIQTIIEDVMALTYMANAHLAVVSDTSTHWGPGEATVEGVLSVAEYAGTHYETLAALMDQQWGVVVTIADYDSSWNAMSAIKSRAGHIQQLLDISLVSRPTFLAEVLGQLADEVRPLLIADRNLT